MANYIEVKVRYTKRLENGKEKKVTEPYLADALSMAEAEAVVINELKPLLGEDYTVRACKTAKYAEIFNLSADRYWLAKVAFITIDEKSGTEKRAISQILVGASDFTNAIEVFNEGMRGSMADFELISLSETTIIEVFKAKLS